jgi:hypothetical protein
MLMRMILSHAACRCLVAIGLAVSAAAAHAQAAPPAAAGGKMPTPQLDLSRVLAPIPSADGQRALVSVFVGADGKAFVFDSTAGTSGELIRLRGHGESLQVTDIYGRVRQILSDSLPLKGQTLDFAKLAELINTQPACPTCLPVPPPSPTPSGPRGGLSDPVPKCSILDRILNKCSE